MAGALILMSVHVAGKAIRDTLFLSNFEITDLPKMMIAASTVSLLAAATVSRILSRWDPARTVPVSMLISAALLVVEWLLVRRLPNAGAVAVYLHLAGLSLVLFSGFWSVVNERFDPYTAKGIVARASGFGALGGVIGGLLAMQLAPRIGVEQFLPGFALLHLVGAGVILALGRPIPLASRRPDDAEGEAEPSTPGLGALRGSLVFKMAMLIALVQAIEQLIDFVFKATASATFPEEASLVRFFAVFYTTSSVIAFALQTSLGPRTLKSIGVGGTLALLPAIVALSSAGTAFFQRIWTVSLLRGANYVLASSLFQAGFELLWTPVPSQTKRRAKVYVDVGARGTGDLLGAGLVLVLVSWIAGLPHWLLLGIAAALSLYSLYLVADLNRGYVDQLARNLRSGALSLDEADVHDATTARALEESRVTLDRAELMARIRELDLARDGATPESPTGEAEPRASAAPLAPAVAELESPDPARIRAALVSSEGRVALAAHVIPLLARPALAEEAIAFLRALAPRIPGQLSDVLLDSETDLLVRRRIPRVLEAAVSGRTLDNLVRGLEDPDFDVQLECVRSALRVAGEADLKLPRAQGLAVVERALEVDDRTWEHHGRRRQSAEMSALLEPGDLRRIDRNLEFVFTALALVFGRDEMASTVRALHSGDLALRGTALEYLQTILPERVRAMLGSRIPGGDRARVTRRRADELADALLHSSATLPRGKVD
jgi:hypothetical protein